jgi:hypothetical protein
VHTVAVPVEVPVSVLTHNHRSKACTEHKAVEEAAKQSTVYNEEGGGMHIVFSFSSYGLIRKTRIKDRIFPPKILPICL